MLRVLAGYKQKIMRKLKVISLTPNVYQVPIRKVRKNKDLKGPIIGGIHNFVLKMATKVLEKVLVIGTLYTIFKISGVSLKVGVWGFEKVLHYSLIQN